MCKMCKTPHHYAQILMSAVERTNVMIMQHAIIHLVATPVTVILDTVEMEEIVQVCVKKYDDCLSHDCWFHKHQISMNVRIHVQVYCVMRMLTAVTLMAVITACVELAILEMDSVVLVCVQIYCIIIHISVVPFHTYWHFMYILTDIDECAEQSDQCDEAHADCSNAVGSYECECNVGFIGDGRHCGNLYYHIYPRRFSKSLYLLQYRFHQGSVDCQFFVYLSTMANMYSY